MSRWLKRSLISASIIVGVLLLSMLIVPWQLKKQATAWIADNTERTLSIEKAYFNPFTLKLELKGINLTEPNSAQPFVSCSRLMLSASLRSVIDRALILRRIELDHPYVKIDMLGDGAFNFSDFMHLGDESASVELQVPAEETKAFLFSFNNIVISGGEVDFNDQASAQSSHHEIRQLELSVPAVGNVAYLADEYVTPELALILNGATIQAQGQSKPFDNSLETELSLTFFDTDLAFYAHNSPVPLPVALQSAVLDCDINLNYQVIGSELPKLLLSGEFVLSNVAVTEPDGDNLFRMDTLLVNLDNADIFQRDITFSEIELYEPQLALTRDINGQLNVIRLFASAPSNPETSTADSEDAPTAQLPLILVKRLAVNDGQISFTDHALSTELTEQVRHLEIEVDNLSTHADQQAKLNFRLATERNMKLAMDGSFMTVPPQAQLDFSLSGLELEPYHPYLEHLLTEAVGGQVDLSGQVSYVDGVTRLADGTLNVRDLLIPFFAADQFTLSELHVQGAAIDVDTQKIHLEKIRLKDGNLKASRLADGSFSPLKQLRQTDADSAKSAQQKQNESAPWSLDLDTFDLSHFKVQFCDESSPKNPAFSLHDMDLHAEQLSYPKSKKSPFKFTAKVGKKGDMAIDGTLVHTPMQLNARSRIKAFPLADFNDFIPDHLQLDLKEGQFFSTISLHLKQQTDEMQGNFSGQLALQRLDLRDSHGGELLSWEGLNVAGIEGNVAPFKLHIKEVALNDYRANIEIDPSGKVNLTSVAPNEGADANVTEETPPAPPNIAAAQQPTEAPADIRIDALTLQGGTVSFTDRHLPSTFATTMYDLGGRVSGLASDEQMQADVDLRGQLENSSPLTITGKINPLSNDLFADLTISFKDIDLFPLTPYSGTYLGYAIDKGKLYLDLSYHIDHQEIQADNRVLIDQFTFGETIDSEEATALPVAMAVSLLKDRNEEIHLDIPISGNLNDPDFSLAGTILSVLRNLLIKAATSPFALLSSMVGGGEDVSSLSFALGSAEITPDQAQKLVGLAKILGDRPSLILEIGAFVDKGADPEAYRHQQLTRMIQALKWRELDDAERRATALQQLVIGKEEYPKLLKGVYKEAEFPRPRNIFGLLKSLPPEEMEKLLLANIRAGDEELAALAKARAMRVRDGLVSLNEELKPRLFLINTDIYATPENGPASRVEFGISAK